ncbi:hypothetical protein T4D_13322 [Trichinella pseudospiralis]|uniref:Uncharacterized protein n=1 Tax=Trichinella pseudospiralis TaxID=6337 RepID=A0A0V1FZ26_TRIPS|nr:hypothetical protein T4D_13322 [Trichinella pseudospiralis]
MKSRIIVLDKLSVDSKTKSCFKFYNKYFMKLYMYPVAVYMMWQLTFQSRGLAVENDEIWRI